MFVVLPRLFGFINGHTAQDAPADSGLLVVGKIGAFAKAKQKKDLLKHVFFLARHTLQLIVAAAYLLLNSKKLCGYLLGWQNEIYNAGKDRTPRHSFIFSGSLVLRECDAAMVFNCF